MHLKKTAGPDFTRLKASAGQGAGGAVHAAGRKD